MSLDDHTISDESDHVVAKRTLRNVLLTQAYGYDDRMSGADLAEFTPVSESTVRDLIGELRAEGTPVYSFGSGYFVVSNRAELERCLEAINDEIQTRIETRENLIDGVSR